MIETVRYIDRKTDRFTDDDRPWDPQTMKDRREGAQTGRQADTQEDTKTNRKIDPYIYNETLIITYVNAWED